MVKCKVCGSEMTVDTSNVLLSSPPRYKAFCENCGDVQYITSGKRMKLIDAEVEAIPVEWLCNYAIETDNTDVFFSMFTKWYKEKENATN